jgi:phage tail P2-like protein
MRALPDVLKNDEAMNAIASTIADALAARTSEIERILIFSKINTLSEDLLDILAVDFKVDWWDGDYTLQQKRDTLLESFGVHRILGTPAAVENAISAIYPKSEVTEWFEYGGDPFHFKLLIDSTFEGVAPAKHQRVLDRVAFYKNLRSHLDGVEYTYLSSGEATIVCALACEALEMTITAEVKVNGLG